MKDRATLQKTVLISGGTSGIGLASAMRLHDEGFCVAVFSSDAKRCAAVRREFHDQIAEGSFLVLRADVTREAEVRKVVHQTIRTFGAIDILINGAGFGYFDAAEQANMKRFRRMLDVNLVGSTILTKAVLPLMRRQRRGLILNLVSVSGKQATFPKSALYAASKFGLMGYSQGLRVEVGRYGIKVATVCPGMVATPFFDRRELARRKRELFAGGTIPMLDVQDVTRIISLICNQSEHADIQDITVLPFVPLSDAKHSRKML